jgi:hypothetical protein
VFGDQLLASAAASVITFHVDPGWRPTDASDVVLVGEASLPALTDSLRIDDERRPHPARRARRRGLHRSSASLQVLVEGVVIERPPWSSGPAASSRNAEPGR